MHRHAVIDSNTHEVKNVIIWDGVTPWKCPDGHYLIRHDECDMEDLYDKENNKFIKKHQRPS